MIEKKVKSLIRKYGTRDPFEIAEQMGVIVIKYPLESGTRGFYNYYKRNSIICVDDNLSETEARHVCAHELGHCVLHRKENSIRLKNTTFVNVNKYEIQANQFASYLLISDEDLEEIKLCGYSTEQASSYLELPEELLKLRIKKGGIE